MQRQTLRYFWDFAHPVCGLARERSNVTPKYGLEAVTTGGSGFGVMAIIVGVSRGWIGRAEAVDRLWTMVRFLLKADSYHGIWPHFLNGDTGRTIPFSRKDDGSDLVETSFLIAGLLCARQYFDGDGRGREPGCAPPSTGCGKRPNGAGTRRAAATCSTGTGARTTAGA